MGWTLLLVIFSTGLYFGYQSFIKPELQPIPIPKEERFFQDDGTSLDWLEDPTIQADAGSLNPGDLQQEGTVTKPLEGDPSVEGEENSPPQSNDENVKQERPSFSETLLPADPLTKIKNKYTVQFKKLERAYQGKMKGLLDQAKGEYIAVKNGEAEVSVMSLATKYMKKANAMEAEADTQFYAVLVKMEQELESQGLSTELIQLAETEYELRKKNQRAALIQKFSSKL